MKTPIDAPIDDSSPKPPFSFSGCATVVLGNFGFENYPRRGVILRAIYTSPITTVPDIYYRRRDCDGGICQRYYQVPTIEQ